MPSTAAPSPRSCSWPNSETSVCGRRCGSSPAAGWSSPLRSACTRTEPPVSIRLCPPACSSAAACCWLPASCPGTARASCPSPPSPSAAARCSASVSSCLLIGGCLLLAPGLMPWDSLWLLPFAALAIRRWWVLIVWTVAEAVFAIGIQLGDVAGFEPSKGLDPSFVALFALLRLLTLVLVVIMAGENLYRRRIRGVTVSADPPRRGQGHGIEHDIARTAGLD